MKPHEQYLQSEDRLSNFLIQSTKFVPLKGSPPIPTQVDCPRPTAVVWKTCNMQLV